MEASLHLQRLQAPICCRRDYSGRTHLKIKPFISLFPHGPSPRCKGYQGTEVSYRVFATADFSRRRPRKGPVSRPKGSAPKGFMPKTLVGMNTKKKDENSDEKQNDSVSASADFTVPEKKVAEVQVNTTGKQETKITPITNDKEKKVEHEEVNRTSITNKQSALGNRDELEVKGTTTVTDKDASELKNLEVHTKSEIKEEVDRTTLAKRWSDVIKSDDAEQNEACGENFRGKEPEEKDPLVKSKMERDMQAYKQALEVHAEENFSRGNKIFVYPEVVKPGQEIEVFLNRSITTLKNEPVVLIMGAFNDWKWNSFTTELRKTELKGDWWSCRVYVPKEAYKINFVFFSGGTIYENNDTKDFFLSVEGGMDALAFEDFLLEEKRRELEKLAAKQAERERQAEDQRRIEAEKATVEANKAQAKSEVEKRRGELLEITKNAVKSVDNVWYIEPSEFKGEDLVRLYYNRSSGSLARSKELWIHGGHNNWKDGVTITGRFVPDGKRKGD